MWVKKFFDLKIEFFFRATQNSLPDFYLTLRALSFTSEMFYFMVHPVVWRFLNFWGEIMDHNLWFFERQRKSFFSIQIMKIFFMKIIFVNFNHMIFVIFNFKIMFRSNTIKLFKIQFSIFVTNVWTGENYDISFFLNCYGSVMKHSKSGWPRWWFSVCRSYN